MSILISILIFTFIDKMVDVSPFLTVPTAQAPPKLETRRLYGGAITMSYPPSYQDVSPFRMVPDHQEVWADRNGTDNSIIVELLNLKEEVSIADAAQFFFKDLADASDAAHAEVVHAGQISIADLCPEIGEAMPDTEMSCAVGVHEVAKFRDEEKSGAAARNKVMVYLANIRLQKVGTDMLVTMYQTVELGEKSSSAARAPNDEDGAPGTKVDEATPMSYPGLGQFVCMLRTLTIRDMGLFG